MNRRTVLIGAGSAFALAGAGIGIIVRNNGSMADYDAEAARLRVSPGANPELGALIGYATLAANSHNTQPWRFRTGSRSIDILPDLARRTPAADPDDHLFSSV